MRSRLKGLLQGLLGRKSTPNHSRVNLRDQDRPIATAFKQMGYQESREPKSLMGQSAARHDHVEHSSL